MYHAGRGPEPYEAVLGRRVGRFGVRAVLGREMLSAGEMRRIEYCDGFAHACAARGNDQDGWAKWDVDHPYWAAELNQAALAAEAGMVDNGG